MSPGRDQGGRVYTYRICKKKGKQWGFRATGNHPWLRTWHRYYSPNSYDGFVQILHTHNVHGSRDFSIWLAFLCLCLMRGRRRHPMAWLKKSLARVKRSAKCFTFHCFCLYQVKLRVIRLLLHGIITYLLPYTDILPVSTCRCSKACEFWSPGIYIFLFLLHLGSAGVFRLSAFGLDGPVSRGVQHLAARQPLHSEWRHTCNTVFSQSLASPGWYSRTLEWTNFCWWVRGIARISPKMGWGWVLISKLSIPQGPPRAKGENLRFRHFTRTAPEPRSAWAPLAPPPGYGPVT